MAGFKSQAKRKRELAKLDKRNAKDQKRAARKAERAGTDAASPAPVTTAAQPWAANQRAAVGNTAPAREAMTLAEAAERWRNTKVVNAKRR